MRQEHHNQRSTIISRKRAFECTRIRSTTNLFVEWLCFPWWNLGGGWFVWLNAPIVICWTENHVSVQNFLIPQKLFPFYWIQILYSSHSRPWLYCCRSFSDSAEKQQQDRELYRRKSFIGNNKITKMHCVCKSDLQLLSLYYNWSRKVLFNAQSSHHLNRAIVLPRPQQKRLKSVPSQLYHPFLPEEEDLAISHLNYIGFGTVPKNSG